jgi:acyl-coenzyme A thioesterase PaaI-like protein
MEENHSTVRKHTKKQPSSKNCFVCGRENPFGLKLDFYETGPGEVVVETIIPEQYQGYPGVVHGGIVAAMLDEVTGRVHMGGDPPRFMFTAKLCVQYRKNVPVGKALRIVGHAGKSRERSALATGEIFGPDGDLLAEAEALMVNVPEEITSQVDLEALGWKVYDE